MADEPRNMHAKDGDAPTSLTAHPHFLNADDYGLGAITWVTA
jgi:hypothetical protein